MPEIDDSLAERGGFEPSEPFKSRQFWGIFDPLTVTPARPYQRYLASRRRYRLENPPRNRNPTKEVEGRADVRDSAVPHRGRSRAIVFNAHNTETVWVTTNDGELLGLLYREDVQRAQPQSEQPA
jgi:hypothetical protein